MSSRPTFGPRAVAALAAVTLTVAGCGSGSAPTPATTSSQASSQSTAAARHADTASKSKARKGPKVKRHATGKAHGYSTSEPRSLAAKRKPAGNAPVGATSAVAATIGRASVSQVVLLHDLAVGVTHASSAPPGVGAPQAATLSRALAGEARQLATAAGGHASDASTLASALTGYAGLAKQLGARPAHDSRPVAAAFVATLRSLDGKWRPAIAAIGAAAHVNLLANIAPLLIPRTA